MRLARGDQPTLGPVVKETEPQKKKGPTFMPGITDGGRTRRTVLLQD